MTEKRKTKGNRTMVVLSTAGQANLETVRYLSGQKTKMGAIEAALSFYVAFLCGGIAHVHTCPGDPKNPGAESLVRLGSRCPYCGWEPVSGAVPSDLSDAFDPFVPSDKRG